MTLIRLETRIHAPRGRVFDLARSIDAHLVSTEGTGERAVAGRTSGLMELGDRVTWEATHFKIKQRLTIKITGMVYPDYFTDEMVRGAFAFIKHRHQFSDDQKTTIVKDEFEFGAPLGLLGLIAEKLFLTNYMERFLVARNEKIKQLAESDKWAQFVE
jgi:ligand-binding SRPBCC domain-containing protein